ncbi:ATP-binding protein [Streptomyces sp. NPDC005438]|uniref:ATP-binding protein n=1 Tax=Streptomyces sp. NPDC005438 TaxID=3156880 RepID=UPI0033B13345
MTGGPSRQHRAASAPGPPLLAVSPPPSTPPARTAGPWPLPNAPECCAQVRGNVRETLTLWGLADLIPQAELLANELAANAVRHGRDPIRLTLALDDDGTLRCLVDDGSVLLPRPRRAAEEDEGGRGLALVALLASRWGAERSPNGKTVWYELGPGSR